MRTESIYLLLALGLAFGEQANRVLGNGLYWMKVSRRNKRQKRTVGSGDVGKLGQEHIDEYLEKFATEYEIIPLMSKLI